MSLAPSNITTLAAADPGDQAAAIVSGDFNGDAIPDVALGAANADGQDNAAPDAGEVYIYYGPFARHNVRDAGAGEADVVIYGFTAGANYGRTLAAGDFDDDGVDDLAVAAPLANEKSGEIHIMFGDPDGIDDDTRATLHGRDADDYAGLMMAAADFDRDGHDDLLIGALDADGPDNSRQDAGEAYVVSGAELVPASSISLGGARLISGAEAGDRLGEAVAAGDVNGDGLPDIIVAAPFASGTNEREAAGETYVFFSPVALPIDMAEAQADLTIIGRDPGDQLGHAIAAGDRNGDGADDIVLGAVSADGPENGVDLAGELVLVDGKMRGVIDASLEDLPTVYGPEKEARLGRYAAAGDLNADGMDDLIVAAPNVAGRAGVVYISYGGTPLPASTDDANVMLIGFDAGDVLGTEVFGTPPFSIADLDGDGRSELLISAPQADGQNNFKVDAGESYAVFFPPKD